MAHKPVKEKINCAAHTMRTIVSIEGKRHYRVALNMMS